MRCAATVVLTLVTLSTAPVLSAQETLHTFFQRNSAYDVVALGDIDQDGWQDFVVVQTTTSQSRARIVTAENWGVRATLPLDPAAPISPSFVTIGDVDADGVEDIAHAQSAGESDLSVYSGADGSLLLAGLPGGQENLACGDVDSDGVPDYVFSRKSMVNSSADWAIVSTATGAVLHSEYRFLAQVPFEILVTEDLDGDGSRDLLVGEGLAVDAAGETVGAIRLHSGASGAILAERFGPFEGSRFGVNFARTKDVDGDGIRDLLVPVQVRSGPAFRVQALRLPRLERLGTQFEVEDSDSVTLQEMGDLNGDGIAELSFDSAPVFWPVPQRWILDGSDLGGLLRFPVHQRSPRPAGDVNRDGRDDFLLLSFDPATLSERSVLVVSGDDLMISAVVEHDSWAPFRRGTRRTVDALLAGGFPGDAATFVLVEFDGRPLFEPLLTAPLDASGRLRVGLEIPPVLEGIEIALQGFARGAGGFRDSGVARAILD